MVEEGSGDHMSISMEMCVTYTQHMHTAIDIWFKGHFHFWFNFLSPMCSFHYEKLIVLASAQADCYQHMGLFPRKRDLVHTL